MKRLLLILPLALLLTGCPGDPPTSPLSPEQQATNVCTHRGGINQLDIRELFVVCKDGTLHDLLETS